MRDRAAGLVQIARDFLEVHATTKRLFTKHRQGDLQFQELAKLIGDDDRSLLFRLKERCHASFRTSTEQPHHREALFDLAIGSLFHEAMKFRENFYQRDVYGPRVQALRSEAESEGPELFEEFGRILQGASKRLEEGLSETEHLLAVTLLQLRHLLEFHADDPLVARFLFLQSELAEAAFARPLEAILTGIFGNPAEGYLRAGESLLLGGYYPDAIRAFDAALAAGGHAAFVARRRAYARGMEAYLSRDYASCVRELSSWATGEPEPTTALARLARGAVERIGQIAEGPDREQTTEAALKLLEQLGDA